MAKIETCKLNVLRIFVKKENVLLFSRSDSFKEHISKKVA